ncbi:MAG: ABC transporter permease [Roseitalea sp.]|nr:ABC transporter permease [Roseitalea sp.]MBO6721224.1 ABC transporter permease [Roseitalea sp.]MBO6744282.1 ABC transporter permease [Roseitalea sp.]
MLANLLTRTLSGFVTLVVVLVIVFFALEALPGDACTAYLERDARDALLAACRERFGLDEPVPARFSSWAMALASGDLGTSILRDRPVGDILWPRFRNTALLAGVAAAMAVPIALVFGTLAALRQDGVFDIAASTVVLVAMTVPEFVIATVLVFIFAIWLQWAPAVVTVSAGAPVGDLIGAIALPAAVLTTTLVAHAMRVHRATVVEYLAFEFVEAARLRGLPKWRIVLFDVLPAALPPTLSVTAVSLAGVLGGVVIIERVFNYPGLGTLALQAILERDLPVLQGAVAVFAVTYVLLAITADLLTELLDPRTRRGTS